MLLNWHGAVCLPPSRWCGAAGTAGLSGWGGSAHGGIFPPSRERPSSTSGEACDPQPAAGAPRKAHRAVPDGAAAALGPPVEDENKISAAATKIEPTGAAQAGAVLRVLPGSVSLGKKHRLLNFLIFLLEEILHVR